MIITETETIAKSKNTERMRKIIKILLLEDNPFDVELLQRELTRSGINYLMEITTNRPEFIEGLIRFKPDLVLSDHSLTADFNSEHALKIARDMYPQVPFILVTGSVSEEFAVKCMQAGVDDYILKGSVLRLPASIKNIFSKKEMKREKELIELHHHDLKTAYRKVEETNKNMTDSISYAKRIQEAMLPEKNILSEIFPESFILFKPKDIVSGDFYWFAKHDEKFIIAVVDCTGHGVPGAFMSMIGYNVLNEIVSVNGITDPGEILKKLNDKVRKILKQDGSGIQTHDGMDVSICVIDKLTRTVEFSGANRPLFYFKNNQLNILPGNKHGIGGMQTAQKEFNTHTFVLGEEDCVYMSTDGFADQFGGDLNKKIMKKNFSKMLKSVKDYEFKIQEQILSYWLKEWQGTNEQTDDILLIGIRL